MLDHPATNHPSLLVGLGTSDDAGVYLLPGGTGRALVQTVDYFTPIVDDPYDWGRIAAANALSDVYAMGATPLTALQMIGWPRDSIPFEVAGRVMEGGADVMAAAGCVVIGGHSIDDQEPTYGFAVTGLVDRGRVVTNAGAMPGDRLVLTKPLGSGIVATALKAGECPERLLAEAVEVMVGLNDVAGSRLKEFSAHAATDVTGFGLVGHLGEMLSASHVGALIEVDRVPLMDGVGDLYRKGFYPGGSRRNLEAAQERVSGRTEWLPLLADAQTSGGLLVALPRESVEGFIAAIPGATEIGRLDDRTGHVELI